MLRAAGSLILLAGLAVAVSACEIMPDPEFAALEKALTLNIAKATLSASGGSVDFRFELTNHASTSAKACLGPSRSVSYKFGSSSGVGHNLVDHPGCMREFAIQPGSVMSWAETLEVPHLSQDRVVIDVNVQIVNPRRCGRWGNCAAFDVRSNPFELSGPQGPIGGLTPQGY